MISLGCAKNLVDAEIMLGSVLQSGMQVTADAGEADVLVVNTCAFIDSAKEESIEAILEAHQQRGLGKKPGQKLIVSGCMVATVFAGAARIDAGGGRVCRAGSGAVRWERSWSQLLDDTTSRSRACQFRHGTAHLHSELRHAAVPSHAVAQRLSEDRGRMQSSLQLCVIPQMRGRHRSRTPASVLSEIRALVAEGVKEINLISQDTTYYGMDLWTEKAGPRQPVDSSRGPTSFRVAARDRRSRAISGCAALYAPGALERLS